MKKKLLATLASTVVASNLVYGETFNAKTMGMSDAGVATSSYLEGFLLNPAALANYESADDFNLHLDIGAKGSDEDELIDNADKLADLLDALNGLVPTTESVNNVAAQLEAINGKAATVEAGGGLYMNIPTRLVSIGVFARSNLTVGVLADVDLGDVALLESAAANLTPLDNQQLNSSIFAMGALVTDIGLTFSRRDGNISYGITPKHQTVEIIDYRAQVGNFDDDDFDADEHTTEDSNFNIDLGIQGQFGSWHAGAVVANAIKQDYKSVSGHIVAIEPRFTVGGGYRNGWFTAALDVDLNSTPNLITLQESQFARLGLEVNAFGWAQLRVGYKSDLESVLNDTVSIGIGLSPFGVVNLDIAAVAGDNEVAGASMQLGFSF